MQKCYSFRSLTKIDEVIAEKPFQNSGVTRCLWTLGRLDWRSLSIHDSSWHIKLHVSQFTLTVLSFYHCSGSSEVHLINTKTTLLRL